ncbi:AMP-dependent synthetase/ligase [Aspergillus terreus]|uniref:AMP-dependent synthetase/ligase n=1 Tax=Aspergillus terreus TaxID=33178 RepID=A0A5M3YT51_ASPTE|nr:hypothetical protein ATETN484_0004002100 [Aspergillus terreus]GFF12911.1 AMP-dependent synthetase/ligase [Aspergillus terreus]
MTRAYDPGLPMSAIPKFFEGAVVNYAENVFYGKNPNQNALIGIREKESLDGHVWTWELLAEIVRKLRSALLCNGVEKGHRVGAIISTSVWSVALFLATASIGAIWTSIAPDIGEEGCVSRLEQILPKILFADSASTFKGKTHCNVDKIRKIVRRLPKKPVVIVIPLSAPQPPEFPTIDDFLSNSKPRHALDFARVPYSHPLYILYTSGTTGQPKCLVHSHSVIIQHKKVSLLHNSLDQNDIVFQYSSTSWVLWNIMVGHLSVGPTLVMYDGSPLWPNPNAMLKMLEHHRVTYWGTSPRYLQELEMTGSIPSQEVDLSSLKMVQTGGSHLAAHQYHWFYRTFPKSVHLTSVTGGTDLVTSWLGTDPAGPLYPGEIQLPMLGQDVDVADPSSGESIKETGRHGEFICRAPFHSMPVFFWGDKEMARYKDTYFDLFPDCWAQHDWASYNPVTKGWQIHGRSDGVLNPQGVRFGSSDIYSIVEASPFNQIISNTLCVGRRRPLADADESVFLFVVMQRGHRLSASLTQRLKDAIRQGLSSRHVPRFVIQVPEIPMTVNGKKIETLIKKVICTGVVPGTVSNTVANPECLNYFQQFYALEDRRSKL